MREKTEPHRDGMARHLDMALMALGPTSNVDAWFVQEVLPMEGALIQFLHRNWRNQSDYADICQDVYVRIYEMARKQIPRPVKPLMFRVARNLLIDRIRRAQVVPIDMVADVEALSVTMDEPGPERVAAARDSLRRVQAALDHLPPRSRDVILMKQVEGLSRREISARLGITEETVKWHLANGMSALADIFFAEAADERNAR
jgi:RNA polymerase sigma factor (sigma-70 family)